MRFPLIILLIAGVLHGTGCESLQKTVRKWPSKDRVISSKLASDAERREAAEKLTADAPAASKPAADATTAPAEPPAAPPAETAIVQQANSAPAPVAAQAAPANANLDATLLQAKQAEQARQNQVAKSLYEQVLQQQPQNTEAHHRLGVLADQEGRYADAQQHYQQALLQQPQNSNLLSDVGYSYFSQDRLNEAEQYLQQSLSIQPDNQYARNNLAQVYGRRAQQTGNPRDYQLAREQFTIALGPQGAEQQMQQLFPQSSPEKKAALNPFKKLAQDMTGARGNGMEAPDPNDGNAKLMRQMAEIRAQMERNGELPPRRPDGAPENRAAMTAKPALPLDQVNAELSRIDLQASQQQELALRRSYSATGRAPQTEPTAGWNQVPAGGIEQASGVQQPGQVRNSLHGGEADAFSQGADPFFTGPPAGDMTWGGPGSPTIAGQSPAIQGQLARGSQMPAGSQHSANAWPQGPSISPVGTSWPDPQGSPTQLDARGSTWDGHSVISDQTQGQPAIYASNGANGSYPGTSMQGAGTSPRVGDYGPQRPGTGSPMSPGADPRYYSHNGAQYGNQYDDARQTAAQLGLDAGLGNMFPGAPAGWGTGNQAYESAPGWSPSDMGNAGRQASGMGQVPAAAYYSSYPNGGASNMVGAGGTEQAAPWNQLGANTSSRTRPRTSPAGYSSGTQNGYGQPSRQTGGRYTSSNLGAPLYYGP